MAVNYVMLPKTDIRIDANNHFGPFKGGRHCFGHGAVNNLPLPQKVIEGLKRLKPGLIRIVLQDYFDVYKGKGQYDWSKLDPYMESFAKTGAKLIVSINLKPGLLYPKVDQTIWQPNDINEWQELIFNLVRRYSVEREYVTYWEHVNEPDIGEEGACPFLLKNTEELFEFYKLTMDAVLKACPSVKVGGPAVSEVDHPFMKGLIESCGREGVRLDFISWHCYNNDPEQHANTVKKAQEYIRDFPGKAPELILDEWNRLFDFAPSHKDNHDFSSVDEVAYQPRRASFTAANLLELMQTDLEWSQYFNIWDNYVVVQPYLKFYSEEYMKLVMYNHWNEIPYRFGFFSENIMVRPQYFVYQMLSLMQGEKLVAECDDKGVKATASVMGNNLWIFVVSYGIPQSEDRTVLIFLAGLNPGMRRLSAFRIDENYRRAFNDMEMTPYEQRMVDVRPDFKCQFYLPSDSVLFVTLEEITDSCIRGNLKKEGGII